MILTSSSGKNVIANRHERRRAAAEMRAKKVQRKHGGKQRSPAVVTVANRRHWDHRSSWFVYPVGPGSIRGARGCEQRKVKLWTVSFSPAVAAARKEAA